MRGRLLGALCAASLLLAGGVWFAVRAYDAPGPLAAARAVVVPRGGAEQTAELLSREGVVGSAAALRLAMLTTRGEGALRTGELAFPAQASLRRVLAVLRFGKPVQHKLTIPEGVTAAQVAGIMAGAPALVGDTPVPEEGGVLPETYLYEFDANRGAVMDRAQRAMDRVLLAAWDSRTAGSAPLATARQALILASIVERETSHADERPRVAAVFLNRLRRGMRLQSDPTVIYGASGGLGVLDHGLTRAELERDDPYNTYRIAGLPPGPISMPGAASLKAVTQPAPTDELFFVADGEGGHVFARSEADHARNVAHWRDVERQRQAHAVQGQPVQGQPVQGQPVQTQPVQN